MDKFYINCEANDLIKVSNYLTVENITDIRYHFVFRMSV